MSTAEELIDVPWGVKVPATARIAWGARAIKQFGKEFELLRDRQGWHADSQEEIEEMSADINVNVLPALREKTHNLMGDDRNVFEDEIAGYKAIYTCGGSCGYLYMSVYK